MKKRYIARALALALCLCAALSACAKAVTVSGYDATPAKVDIDALKRLTFGDELDKAKLDETRDDGFFSIPDEDGPPFCCADDTGWARQARVSILTRGIEGETHYWRLHENVEPSGVAKCELTRDEALAQAESVMAELGLQGYILQSVTANGRLTECAGDYMVAFGQTINGCPVYWAADVFLYDLDIRPDSNRACIVLGDSGIVDVTAYWYDFAPVNEAREALTGADAIAALALLGEQADTAELCYLLRADGKTASATPAYRHGSRFIHAVTGELLQ